MLVDPQHPFFRRLWVRILCVILPLMWAVVEFRNDAIFWGGLFAASGIYLFVMLFILRKNDEQQ